MPKFDGWCERSSPILTSMVGSAIAAICSVAMVALILLTTGCGSPSGANIELRKQKQALQDQVDQLTAQHLRDADALAACQRSHPTTAMLSADRLKDLVTTQGLSFNHLTGGDNPDSTKAFDSQLKIYVVPIDNDSTPIKAAGTFKIEAFDLDDPAKPSIGSWNFNLKQTRELFYSRFSLYTYVLNCPLTKPSIHPNLTVRVTFDDALTGGEFVDQVQVKIRSVATRP